MIAVIFLFDQENKLNGQNVRSTKILKSLDSSDIEYKVFFGYEGVENILYSDVKFEHIYMENGTLPCFYISKKLSFRFMFSNVYNLLAEKSNGKTVLFYRDVHWLFYRERGWRKFLKHIVLKNMFHLELMKIKKSKVNVCLPSLKMNKYIKIKSELALEFFPGFDDFKNHRLSNADCEIKLVYSGNINCHQYDIRRLLAVIKDKKMFSIDIFCPASSFQKFNKEYGEYKKEENINFYFDQTMKNTNKKWHFFMDFRESDEYLDFSMPLKIFEALSINLPIISNGRGVYVDYIQNNSCGLKVSLDDIEIIRRAKFESFEPLVSSLSWSKKLGNLIQ